MIDHAGISVSDFAVAKAFYDQALAPLGASLLFMVPMEQTGGVLVGGYGRDQPAFWLNEDGVQIPPAHFAFSAETVLRSMLFMWLHWQRVGETTARRG